VSELDSDPYPVPLAQPPAPSSDSDYSSVEEIEGMEEELAEDDGIEDMDGEGGKGELVGDEIEDMDVE
jgi:hypothetical protein